MNKGLKGLIIMGISGALLIAISWNDLNTMRLTSIIIFGLLMGLGIRIYNKLLKQRKPDGERLK